MTIKNYKTTAAGIVGIIAGLGAIAGNVAGFLPPKYAGIALGVSALAAAVGNIAAKDYDVHSDANEVKKATEEEAREWGK